MRIVLLALAIALLAWDVFQGLRRGFYPALVRLGFVCLCLVGAYFLSAPLSGLLTGTPLPFLKGQTFHEAYEAFLLSKEEIARALSLSEVFKELVFRLPDVLLTEIDFLILFALLRLITLPISYLISLIFFGRRGRRVKIFGGSFRLGGMAVGFLQGVVCLAVILVPIFGVVEFGERLTNAFSDTEEPVIAEIVQTVEDNVVEPVNESMVTRICNGIGIRSLCVKLFHGLSSTEVRLSSGVRTIDYFEYLESMFPALSALVKLADVDPEHMTDKDYANLADVLHTAKNNEELSHVVKDSVSNVVTEFVDESYRDSADIVVTLFAEKVVGDKEQINSESLRAEVQAIQDTLKVIQTATSEAADSAFEVVSADTLVDGIIKTEILYETLVEVATDPEKREVLCKDFAMSESQKAEMKVEIEKYRNESSEKRSPEELAKILEITDALGLMLGVELEELSDLLPE